MKFLEKVKNMFTEEVEEVKPIKSEVRKVEIVPPTKTSNNEEIVLKIEKKQEIEVVKEEKPKAPVFFDDKDFDKLPTSSNIEKPKEAVSKTASKNIKEPVRKEAYGGKNPAFSASVLKEEKRTFKPTPIISPVYGVLDKNYKKDDIAPKKRVIETKRTKELTIDDIRNKAFGTLEDDLETTLFGNDTILTDDLLEQKVDDIGLDLFDELEESPKHEKEEPATRAEKNKELELLNEVDDLGQMVINERPEFDLAVEEEPSPSVSEESNNNMIEDEMDKICNEPNQELEDETNLTESDLFNLIDSMYEKKDGEE